MENKKILLVDDHPAIRHGLKQILRVRFDNLQFYEAENASQCLRLLPLEKWDLLILDISLPDKSGLDVLSEIKKLNHCPVLLFSFHNEEQIAVNAIRLGADGYLSKDASELEIAHAVGQLLLGEKFISHAISARVATYLINPIEENPHELLSEREYQTFLAIARGKSMAEFAEEISLSISTVNTYRARVLEKMKMKSNFDLIRYALYKRLIG
jgi:two-component system, NarL family, invasion response regulator UvrY